MPCVKNKNKLKRCLMVMADPTDLGYGKNRAEAHVGIVSAWCLTVGIVVVCLFVNTQDKDIPARIKAMQCNPMTHRKMRWL